MSKPTFEIDKFDGTVHGCCPSCGRSPLIRSKLTHSIQCISCGRIYVDYNVEYAPGMM